MPESLLTILKFCFLALLYLFFIRVVRAVWAEVTGMRPATVTAAPAPAPAPATKERAATGKRVARLKIVEPAQQQGKTYDVGSELTVGRAAGCQIPLDDSYASQVHARLFQRDGQVFVEDLGSTNGSKVNGARVREQPLTDGDEITLGKTLLRFEAS